MLLSRTNTATRYLAPILVFLRGKLPNKLTVGLKHLKIICHQISCQICARSWQECGQLCLEEPACLYWSLLFGSQCELKPSCDACDGLDVGRGGEGGEAEGEEGGQHWDHSEGKKGEDNKLILDQANCKSTEMGSNLFWPDQYLGKIFFGNENTHSL